MNIPSDVAAVPLKVAALCRQVAAGGADRRRAARQASTLRQELGLWMVELAETDPGARTPERELRLLEG